MKISVGWSQSGRGKPATSSLNAPAMVVLRSSAHRSPLDLGMPAGRDDIARSVGLRSFEPDVGSAHRPWEHARAR
eukprot:9271042-Alexandrium_andersonii.AAC.1